MKSLRPERIWVHTEPKEGQSGWNTETNRKSGVTEEGGKDWILLWAILKSLDSKFSGQPLKQGNDLNCVFKTPVGQGEAERPQRETTVMVHKGDHSGFTETGPANMLFTAWILKEVRVELTGLSNGVNV